MTYPREKQFGSVLQVSDIASSGVLPLAPGQIEAAGLITIAQATTGITVTLPIPSDGELRSVTIINIGSAPVTVNTQTIPVNDKHNFVFFNGSWY